MFNKLSTEDSELDEELIFLTKQMEFADYQNDLLENKIDQMQAGEVL